MRIRLAVVAVAAAAALGACGGDAATIDLVDAAEAEALIAAPPPHLVVLDVRTPEEFGSERITGATNIDYYAPDFAARLDELDKERPYFVYCRTGNRSAMTIDIMRDLGFTHVYELEGGIASWAQAGMAIER